MPDKGLGLEYLIPEFYCQFLMIVDSVDSSSLDIAPFLSSLKSNDMGNLDSNLRFTIFQSLNRATSEMPSDLHFQL